MTQHTITRDQLKQLKNRMDWLIHTDQLAYQDMMTHILEASEIIDTIEKQTESADELKFDEWGNDKKNDIISSLEKRIEELEEAAAKQPTPAQEEEAELIEKLHTGEFI